MTKKENEIEDEDIDNAGEAFKRAAANAREIARRTGTPLVFYEDGKILKEKVD